MSSPKLIEKKKILNLSIISLPLVIGTSNMKLEEGVRKIFYLWNTALVKIGGLAVGENNLCCHLELRRPQKGPYIDEIFKNHSVRKADVLPISPCLPDFASISPMP